MIRKKKKGLQRNNKRQLKNQNKQFMLISYDISDDRRRTKVMKHMENFGRRVQYSVFECELKQDQLSQLKERLKPLVKEAEDSIRFYYLSEDNVRRIETMGDKGLIRDPIVYIATAKKKGI